MYMYNILVRCMVGNKFVIQCFMFSFPLYGFSSLIRKGSLTSCEEELREVGNCFFLYYNGEQQNKNNMK